MRVLAVLVGLIAAFFVFYTARLLVVTKFLTQTRVGGRGAFIGAVVFPLLAVGFGVISIRLWRRGVGSRRS